MIGVLHTACGVLALLLGARVLLWAKGTPAHVRVGRAYALSMLGLNLSALGIYHLTGRFNLFHLFALISLVTLTIGLAQVVNRRRRPKWLWRHYQYMAWSYVGLLAATSNEAFVRVVALRRVTAATTPALPLLVMAAILVISAGVIFSVQRRTLARYSHHV